MLAEDTALCRKTVLEEYGDRKIASKILPILDELLREKVEKGGNDKNLSLDLARHVAGWSEFAKKFGKRAEGKNAAPLFYNYFYRFPGQKFILPARGGMDAGTDMDTLLYLQRKELEKRPSDERIKYNISALEWLTSRDFELSYLDIESIPTVDFWVDSLYEPIHKLYEMGYPLPPDIEIAGKRSFANERHGLAEALQIQFSIFGSIMISIRHMREHNDDPELYKFLLLHEYGHHFFINEAGPAELAFDYRLQSTLYKHYVLSDENGNDLSKHPFSSKKGSHFIEDQYELDDTVEDTASSFSVFHINRWAIVDKVMSKLYWAYSSIGATYPEDVVDIIHEAELLTERYNALVRIDRFVGNAKTELLLPMEYVKHPSHEALEELDKAMSDETPEALQKLVLAGTRPIKALALVNLKQRLSSADITKFLLDNPSIFDEPDPFIDYIVEKKLGAKDRSQKLDLSDASDETAEKWRRKFDEMPDVLPRIWRVMRRAIKFREEDLRKVKEKALKDGELFTVGELLGEGEAPFTDEEVGRYISSEFPWLRLNAAINVRKNGRTKLLPLVSDAADGEFEFGILTEDYLALSGSETLTADALTRAFDSFIDRNPKTLAKSVEHFIARANGLSLPEYEKAMVHLIEYFRSLNEPASVNIYDIMFAEETTPAVTDAAVRYLAGLSFADLENNRVAWPLMQYVRKFAPEKATSIAANIALHKEPLDKAFEVWALEILAKTKLPAGKDLALRYLVSPNNYETMVGAEYFIACPDREAGPYLEEKVKGPKFPGYFDATFFALVVLGDDKNLPILKSYLDFLAKHGLEIEDAVRNGKNKYNIPEDHPMYEKIRAELEKSSE